MHREEGPCYHSSRAARSEQVLYERRTGVQVDREDRRETQGEAIDRRETLKRLGKYAVYAAPVLMAVMSPSKAEAVAS